MKSSVTNHVLASAKAKLTKNSKAHLGQLRRADAKNQLTVHQMNLRSQLNAQVGDPLPVQHLQ